MKTTLKRKEETLRQEKSFAIAHVSRYQKLENENHVLKRNYRKVKADRDDVTKKLANFSGSARQDELIKQANHWKELASCTEKDLNSFRQKNDDLQTRLLKALDAKDKFEEEAEELREKVKKLQQLVVKEEIITIE